MSRTAFRYAVEADIPVIAADARQADVDEMAAGGKTFEQALRASLKDSVWAITGLVDGVPAAMWGVAPVNVCAGIGAPWLLSGNRVMQVERRVCLAARDAVEAMLDTFPRLTNVVDERNVLAIKWLKWLGFEFANNSFDYRGHAFRAFRKGEW